MKTESVTLKTNKKGVVVESDDYDYKLIIHRYCGTGEWCYSVYNWSGNCLDGKRFPFGVAVAGTSAVNAIKAFSND